MSRGLTLPAASVEAPAWRDNPAAWACWYLRTNPGIYRAFRKLVDDARKLNPDVRISADQVLHVMRWNQRMHAKGDLVAINDHASSLFARLYVEETPEANANFELRKSLWDHIHEREWAELMVAFEPIRRPRRDV